MSVFLSLSDGSPLSHTTINGIQTSQRLVVALVAQAEGGKSQWNMNTKCDMLRHLRGTASALAIITVLCRSCVLLPLQP